MRSLNDHSKFFIVWSKKEIALSIFSGTQCLKVFQIFFLITIIFFTTKSMHFLFRSQGMDILLQKSSSKKCHKIPSTHMCPSLLLRKLHVVGLQNCLKEILTQVLSKFAGQLFVKTSTAASNLFVEKSNLILEFFQNERLKQHFKKWDQCGAQLNPSSKQDCILTLLFHLY